MVGLGVPNLVVFDESGHVPGPLPVQPRVFDIGIPAKSPEIGSLQPVMSRQISETAATIVNNDSAPEIILPEKLLADKVSVWGIIQTEFGDIPGYDQILLYSPTRGWPYRAYSDYTGYFRIDRIAPATDYFMRIIPRGNYRQHIRRSLDLTASETDLSAIVSAIPVATLSVEVVDADGYTIPGYGVKVVIPNRLKWSATAITDEVGRFRVDNIPIGELEFSSTFGDPLRITGHQFAGEFQAPITLVVDHGPNELRGQVYDQFNNLVSGARVVLGWEKTGTGIHSVVNRHTITSSSGQFVLQGIGRGEHELVLTTDTGVAHRQTVDIGIDNSDLTIVLSQAPLPN
jgi:hypothetical protein